jgi:hypothetical protein
LFPSVIREVEKSDISGVFDGLYYPKAITTKMYARMLRDEWGVVGKIIADIVGVEDMNGALSVKKK